MIRHIVLKARCERAQHAGFSIKEFNRETVSELVLLVFLVLSLRLFLVLGVVLIILVLAVLIVLVILVVLVLHKAHLTFAEGRMCCLWKLYTVKIWELSQPVPTSSHLQPSSVR